MHLLQERQAPLGAVVLEQLQLGLLLDGLVGLIAHLNPRMSPRTSPSSDSMPISSTIIVGIRTMARTASKSPCAAMTCSRLPNKVADTSLSLHLPGHSAPGVAHNVIDLRSQGSRDAGAHMGPTRRGDPDVGEGVRGPFVPQEHHELGATMGSWWEISGIQMDSQMEFTD